MSSSPCSTPITKKRSIKSEPTDSNADSDTPPSSSTPSKKVKTGSTPKKTPTKADAWSPELRLKLFEAYQASSQTKWEDVASKVGSGKGAKECREQWQRATGKRIRAALGEKS